MSYDKKYRKRVIEYLEEGHTYRETSKAFKLSLQTIRNWKVRYESTGTLEAKKPKGRPPKIDPTRLTEYVKSHPDAYQSEIAEHFGCVQQAICFALKRLNITRKKRQSGIKSKTLKK